MPLIEKSVCECLTNRVLKCCHLNNQEPTRQQCVKSPLRHFFIHISTHYSNYLAFMGKSNLNPRKRDHRQPLLRLRPTNDIIFHRFDRICFQITSSCDEKEQKSAIAMISWLLVLIDSISQPEMLYHSIEK